MADVVLLPRYPIPGYEDLSPEEAADLLHQEKNRPEPVPSAVLRKVLTPAHLLTPEQRLFPYALYRPWIAAAQELARYRTAARMNINLSARNPIEREQVDQVVGEYETVLAITQADLEEKLASGWYRSPAEAKRAAFLAHRDVATNAALSMHDDRHLSEQAKAHREAVEDAADDHVTEIPRTPIPTHRKRGRPRNEERA